MSTIKWIRFLDLEQHLRTKILRYLEVYLLFTNRLIADIWKKLKKKKKLFSFFPLWLSFSFARSSNFVGIFV